MTMYPMFQTIESKIEITNMTPSMMTMKMTTRVTKANKIVLLMITMVIQKNMTAMASPKDKPMKIMIMEGMQEQQNMMTLTLWSLEKDLHLLKITMMTRTTFTMEMMMHSLEENLMTIFKKLRVALMMKYQLVLTTSKNLHTVKSEIKAALVYKPLPIIGRTKLPNLYNISRSLL